MRRTAPARSLKRRLLAPLVLSGGVAALVVGVVVWWQVAHRDSPMATTPALAGGWGALVALTVIGLFAAFVYRLVQRIVLRPLAEITAVMARRRAGDDTALASLRTSDELAALARTFDDLIAATADSEERFHQIAEHVDDCFWIFDVGETVRCRYASRAYETMTGYSRDALYTGDEGLRRGVHPDDVPRLVDAWSRMRDQPMEVEYRLTRADGVERWIRSRWFPVRTAGGRLDRVAGVTIDVTERRRAERLAEERALLTAVVAEVGVALNRGADADERFAGCVEAIRTHLVADFAGIWVLTPDGAALAPRAFACPTVLDASVSARVPAGVGAVGRVVAERRPRAGCVGSDADGRPSLPWVERAGWKAFAVHPLLVGDRVMGVVGVFAERELGETVQVALASVADLIAQQVARDEAVDALRREQEHKLEATAAARREAERRVVDLALAEERLQAIVDHALDAAIAIDESGRVTAWNPQAETTFKWTAAEAIGLQLHELVMPPDQRGEHDGAIARFLTTGQPNILNRRREIVAQDRDGRIFPVELAVTAYRVDERWCFSAFLRDITVRKEAEAELIQARETALELAQLKSSFLATMSHEIRTPMNAVIGMTGLLADTGLDAEQRELLGTIRSAGEQLLTIINDILDFSKMEAGRLEIEVVEFEVRPILEEVLDLFAGRAAAKGVELVLDVGEAVPARLGGDVGRLRQVLANLVGNAIKFTEIGEVVITLTGPSSDDGLVRFTVSDTGIGIAPEQRNHLFDPFVQADGSMSRRYEGTGLGLSIARQLVHLMGGEIGFESVAGVGSVFWFSARLAPVPAVVDERPPVDLRGRRLLLVDDNESCRRVTAALLERWGATVDAVADAPQALERVRAAGAARYDLAIVDEVLPLLGGAALVSRIRQSAAGASLPIVLLSTGGAKPSRDGVRGGASSVIAKPIRAAGLGKALADLLASGPGPAVSSTPAATVPAPGGRGRVLVVEDNATNQRLMCALLRRLGFDAETAGNGEEALHAWERGTYAVILMDCQMPVMDGFEATTTIRRRERAGEHTPIVAITANVMPGTRERCHAAGMDDYLAKPVRLDDLEQTLAQWVAVGRKAAGGGAVVLTRQGGAFIAPQPAGHHARTRSDHAAEAAQKDRYDD